MSGADLSSKYPPSSSSGKRGRAHIIESDDELSEGEAPLPARRRSASATGRFDSEGDFDDDADALGASTSFLQKRRGQHTFVYSPDDDAIFKKLIRVDNPSEKEQDAWDGLAKDAKQQCLKAVARLFLTKGARAEVITRTVVGETLAKVNDSDGAYKKHINAVILAVQIELMSNFGFQITTGVNLPPGKGKKDEYHLVNRVKSVKLQEVLAELTPNDAYMGFVFVVMQVLNTAPGKKLDQDAILRNVRKIDGRFPETLVQRGKGDSSLSVPELNNSFTGLLTRMEKERYIVKVKDDSGARSLEDVKKTFELGSRFYAEFGSQRLAKTYFAAMGEEVDQGVLTEATKLDNDMLRRIEEAKKAEEGDPPAVAEPVAERPKAGKTKQQKK